MEYLIIVDRPMVHTITPTLGPFTYSKYMYTLTYICTYTVKKKTDFSFQQKCLSNAMHWWYKYSQV